MSFLTRKNRLLNLFTLTSYKTISKNNKSSAPSISRQAPKNTIVIFTAPNGLKSKATPTIIKRIPIVRSLPQPIASNTRRSSALWILLIPSSISTTPSRNGKNDTTVCGVIRQNTPSAIKITPRISSPFALPFRQVPDDAVCHSEKCIFSYNTL